MQDFYQIQEKINDFLNNISKDESFTQTFWKLSTNDAIFCAWDIIRNKAFFQSIKISLNEIRKNNKIVIDAWSWTWILWFFALSLWANEVIFIEKNKNSLEVSKSLAKYLWYFEKCTFLEEDACEVKINKNYDLIISETITTWFIEEEFPFIIENLKKDNAKIIPERFTFYIKWFDELSNLIEEQEIELESKNLFKNNKITLNKNIKTLEISSKIYLYNDIFINSWDSISFANKRIFDLKNKHNFFEFILK